MFESKVREKVLAVYYIALAAMMYYMLDDTIFVYTVIPTRQICVLLLIFSGFVSFLIRPNIARGVEVLKGTVILSAPLLAMVMVSLPIWITRQIGVHEFKVVIWHHAVYVNQVFAALTAGVFLYQFGEKGIWYNLAAILIANAMIVVTIMAESGVAVYLREFARLIMTFAGETGEVIAQAELHELVFCLGAYLIYMMVFAKKTPGHWVLFGLTTFLFLSAFKRIAMASIALTVVAGVVLNLLAKANHRKWVDLIISIAFVLIIILLVLYIGFVEAGGFRLLEEVGVNTMSRADMYELMEDYYEFSPSYTGKGTGYLSYQLTYVLPLWVQAIHNDFLQHFIDLGFFGYIFWLLSLTVLRTWYFGRNGNTDAKVGAFVITCYMLILSTTDNTLNYQMFFTVTSLLIMGHGYDKRVRKTDERLFGYIEESNRL